MFKLRLFGKLNLWIAICITSFYWLLTDLNEKVETEFSYIAEAHKEQLMDYAKQAENIIATGNAEQLQAWKDAVSRQEDTLVAVIKVDIHDLVDTEWDNTPYDGGYFGRHIDYPIHLYHTENPLMDIPFGNDGYHLLIRLPQRMRPGAFWNELYFASRTLLPFLFAMLISYLLYRYLLSPLRKLKYATRRYANGDFSTKIYPAIARRQDEISDLAASFDDMGSKLSSAISQQRQLIQDISHELRTPLTRIQLSLDGNDAEEVVNRVKNEVGAMRKLVEGTLTLAWLENEKPQLNKDSIELPSLIESIIEDARFEFPSHPIKGELNEIDTLKNSSHLALSQSIENIIRNACKYTPEGKEVLVKLWQQQDDIFIEVADQGPGIDEQHLEDIFKPFFRLEESRDREKGGFGLGLALSKRQVEACGGRISAHNRNPQGLLIQIELNNCKKRKNFSSTHPENLK
ncbi:ATP-binding protein [Pseudoteredinibacter isoporae]|uniref:histidine kinase n=1 Tax=Pseudoteredinibacter isoporae TaxID=570281 RepID=A0A7X0MV90_9GAMM|nr:two-component system sensor histidine kinase PfeS [Pseudoteredinibacter isoporae]NHO87030.1 HAMP domain-containing protein [Pseudoteredinibacter isoporae]NIB24517.1 HAMP domain-containing protein [Pseudoteredinibacter isoporae]